MPFSSAATARTPSWLAKRSGGRYGTITVYAPSVRAAAATGPACSPAGTACTLHTARPAAARSAASPAGSLRMSKGSTAP